MIFAVFIGVIVIALIISALFVFVSVGRFKHYWESQNAKSASENSLTIVALGDSTMQGIGATSPQRGFIGLVAKDAGRITSRPVTIYNYSKSGGKVRDVLETQLPEAIKINSPDLILIAVGPNDITGKTDRDTYMRDYSKILSQLPASKVIIANIPPLGRRHVNPSVIDDWNTGIVGMAQRADVRVAPIFEAINPRRNNPLIYSCDFFHPSNYGYTFWAKAFEQQAKEILNK